MKGGTVYLLENEKGTHRYLGSTSDIHFRIEEHNRGVTKATRYNRPWIVLQTWTCESLTEARQIEIYIKKKKRKLTIEYVTKMIEKWRSEGG